MLSEPKDSAPSQYSKGRLGIGSMRSVDRRTMTAICELRPNATDTQQHRRRGRRFGLFCASVLWSEGLSRHFDNRRQVAAYAGLAPTLWKYVSAGVVIEGAMIGAA
jgi:hypothetical protein